VQRRYLLLLGLLGFAATLALHTPAALLYAWSGPRPETGLQLHGIQGTLGQGGFSALSVQNRPVLRDVSWSLHPAWLAMLRLTADVQAAGDTVIRARVSRAPFGALRVSDLNAAGTVKSLLGMAGQAALPVEGQLRLDLPVLRLEDGVPVAAEGSADLENLAWTLAREPMVLGSFNAGLSTDDKGILVNIGSGPGPLEAAGTATLSKDRLYDLHLQLRARPEATPALQSYLRSLGQPDAEGWYHIRRNGSL
jgi:general secretion pathway protein N